MLDLNTLKENDIVLICNGEKEPPKSHSKKHFNWQRKNRLCLVHRYEPQYGRLGVKDRVDAVLVDSLPTYGLTVTKIGSNVEELECYCRDAQELFVDACEPSTATSLLKESMLTKWQKKQNTNKFVAMMDACGSAHCAWVESDTRDNFNHLKCCLAKARAWKDVLDFLNNGFELPFTTPANV